jgi:hypothetical protein
MRPTDVVLKIVGEVSCSCLTFNVPGRLVRCSTHYKTSGRKSTNVDLFRTTWIRDAGSGRGVGIKVVMENSQPVAVLIALTGFLFCWLLAMNPKWWHISAITPGAFAPTTWRPEIVLRTCSTSSNVNTLTGLHK